MSRERLPERRQSRNVVFYWANIKHTATLGFYEDGRLGEIFLASRKLGTATDVSARDSAIAVSHALQNGADPIVLRNGFTRNMYGEPEGPLGVLFDQIYGEPDVSG